jgi:hypothetical protein
VRRLVIGCLSVLLAGRAQAGRAPAFAKLTLVPAQCGTTTFGPCAPRFAFRSGSVVLFGAKEPAPTCPGSSMPEQKVGMVTLSGLTQDGTPFDGTLHTETMLKTTFGTEGSCSLRGTEVIVPSLTGDVTCKAGRCRGVLLPVACLPADCVHTSITSEFVSFKVLDPMDPNGIIAAPGTILAPLR